MLAEDGGIGAEHPATADLKSGFLKALEDFADFPSGNTIGFEKNQSGVHEAAHSTRHGRMEKQILSGSSC